MAKPALDAGATHDWTARARLALSPTFAADVIELDDEDLVRGLFRPCVIVGCLRMAAARGRCWTHHDRWRSRGCPDAEAFGADAGPQVPPERIRIDDLPPRLRLEVGLGLQLAATEHRPRTRMAPSDVRRIVQDLRLHQVSSILSDDDGWTDGLSTTARRVLGVLRRAVEDFLTPPDPSTEFERDVWRLSVMGCATPTGGVGRNRRLRFDGILQPWLRHLVKRFMRWRIATGRSYHQMNRDITALQRMANALTKQAGSDATVSDFSRATIEAYLAVLTHLGLKESSRSYDISSVATFLRTVRQHNWQPDLSPSADVFPGDHPRRPTLLPRALPEFVMAQIESPQSLARLEQPHRLMMQILIGTGLRQTDAYRLEIDCLVRDGNGAPYLRYRNHKMNREAVVPVDDQLAVAIEQQARDVVAQVPKAVLLTPAPDSADGRRPWFAGAITGRLDAWQETIGLHDAQGRPFRFTAHQLRHTYATRLINADVPQEIVRRLLDHSSTEMTAHYARLHDQTIRRHWERAQKVNIRGETVVLAEGSPLSDAAWMKETLGRATMALPNGYCGLPLQQSCPHANACLTCPVFITTPDFLSEHLAQLRATNKLIGEAEANGQVRVVEMNQQVATNLQNIIAALDDPADSDSAEKDTDAS